MFEVFYYDMIYRELKNNNGIASLDYLRDWLAIPHIDIEGEMPPRYRSKLEVRNINNKKYVALVGGNGTVKPPQH